MKICHYIHNQSPIKEPRLGIVLSDENLVIDPNLCYAKEFEREGFYHYYERANHRMPDKLSKLLRQSEKPIEELEEAYALYLFFKLLGETHLYDGTAIAYPLNDESIRLSAPLDKIETYRDFYAHEKHVAKGFEKRGEPIPSSWYEMPVYYKGATCGFIGPNEEILWPNYSDKLDFELELAVIIARDGKNIKAENASEHIFGYTILNDISARDIQKKEMSVRLGPSKGKDFCSVIGPVIVTADEFDFKEPNLQMRARINNELWSEGKSGDVHFSFAQMIEFASKEEWLLAGDLMGSGTVGSGCGLELDRWIKPGDVIELDIEKIGTLTNTVGSKRMS